MFRKYDEYFYRLCDLADQIFEAMDTPSDQRSDKKHEILKDSFTKQLKQL